MKIKINLAVRDARWKTALKPYTKTVRVAAGAALSARRIKKGELTVVLAGDSFIRELNKTYRGKNQPTNVLSFTGEGDYLGDIILAYETILREAKAQHKTARHHAAHLIVHGVLHVLGYDHNSDAEAQTMERLEINILKKLGISNPYL